MLFGPLQGLCETFHAQIPLFLFFGVFIKLFLYRPFPRYSKQVTLDFWYLTTNFFGIGPVSEIFPQISQFCFFTLIISCGLIILSIQKGGFYYALRKNSKGASPAPKTNRHHSGRTKNASRWQANLLTKRKSRQMVSKRWTFQNLYS